MSAAEPRHRRWTDARPWHTNAALIVIGLGLICYTLQMTSENDGFYIGFSGCSTGSVILFLGAVLILLVNPRNVDRYTLPIILCIAAACRIVGVFPDPFLSSDVYRYAWDGVVQHHGINPYRFVPGDPALAFLRIPYIDLFDNMNRRDYAHTIYPPVAQIAFYLITWLSPTVTFMKTAMVLFEALTVYGLILLLRRLGVRQEWVLLYAWCPLCIWEFGSSGHVDAVLIALMVLALLFRAKRRPALTGLFLGLAIFTKFYPIVLFPALYQRQPDGKLDWKMPAVIVVVGVLSYSLYLSAGKLVFGFLGGYVQEEGIATGTRYFPLDFVRSLPGLHTLPNSAYEIFCVAVFLCLAAWAWRTCCRADSNSPSFITLALCFAFALMLLFSPHYPWYIAWLIPFLVLAPSLTVLTYICVSFYLRTTALASGLPGPEYHLNKILYACVLLAALGEWALHRIPQTRAWRKQIARSPHGLIFNKLSQTSSSTT